MSAAAPVMVRLTPTTSAPWPDPSDGHDQPPLRHRGLRIALALVLTAALAVPVWQALHPREGTVSLSAPVMVIDEGRGGLPGVVPTTPRVRVVPAMDPAPVVDPGSSAPSAGGTTRDSADAACAAPCTTSQVVSATVLPGPFTVEAGQVVLGLDSGAVVGSTAATVTDLRGSAVPWTLAVRWDGGARTAAGAALALGSLQVEARCERTDGPLTVTSAPPTTVSAPGTVRLCQAPVVAEGSLAGGLVEVSVRVTASGVEDPSLIDGATLGLTWVLVAA